MELFSFTLTGHRRFKDRCFLRTNGKLVALIGPNEAGKSTIIRALDDFDSDNPAESGQFSRGRSRDTYRLVCKYLLDKGELACANLTGPRWLIVEKRSNGKKFVSFEPPCPPRDTSHRDVVAKHVFSILNDGSYRAELNENDPELADKLERFMGDLVDAPPDLSATVLSRLRELRSEFEAAFADNRSKPLSLALSSWSQMIEFENAKSPTRHAIDEIYRKTPDYLFFDETNRNLASTYEIAALRSEIPQALQNLLDVAELEPAAMFAAIDGGDGPAVSTLEHRANKTLEEKFAKHWEQSGVRVAVRISPGLLEVHVVNEASEFSALAERSDGLRQFVALYSFALCRRAKTPILLIDEAEQHLHYNAQADLVQMLAKQNIASKIIYSTHSAGCLPADLGNGVRLVRPTATDETASEIINKFWADGDDGVLPLLIGLGASTLAFFPTRRAVLVEGPVDMLLYPTLFREFLDVEVLRYQFVHGLSTTGQALAPLISGKDAHICYLTDGDEGGVAIVRQLRNQGVANERILILRNSDGTAVEIEDFINPKTLLLAANRLLERFHSGVGQISGEDLTIARRMNSLEAAYLLGAGVPVPKVELAYELLDILDENPGSGLLDPKRRTSFGKIAQKVEALFTA